MGTLLAAILLVLIWAGTTPAHAQADTTAPTISSIAITSNPDDDVSENGPYPSKGDWYTTSRGVYGIDDAIQVTVTFGEEVVVTGTPRVELDFGSMSTRFAEYESVNGRSVIFGYTVAEGDSATDGIAVAASKLTLNGGSIKDAADNSANLSHDAIARQSSHRVDGIRPKLSSLTITPSTYNTDEVFGPDDEVIIFASFSELAFGSESPAPQLRLDFDGVEKLATWKSTFAIGDYFSYYIQEGDSDLDGIEIAANSVVLNGGYFRDAAGNDASDLTHPAVAADYRNKVDAVAPTISSMAITSDPGEDDTYGSGDQIEVTVTFSENVTVPAITRSDMPGIRRPQLELDFDGEAKTADYLSHQGPAVVFVYNVRASDTDDDGISISANKLVLNGGVIKDKTDRYGFGTNDADLSHDAVAADPNHKVAGASSSFTLSGDTSLQYWENETSSMEVSRMDQYRVSGASGEVTWSLSGDDSDDFAINQGALSFVSPPNYEAPTDADADNLYRVRIHASDEQNKASLQVTVSVFNRSFDDDEVPVITGTVQVGQTLTADMSLITDSDKDATTFVYRWFSSDSATTDIWDTVIDGANSASYTLTAADIGKSITVAGYSWRWPDGPNGTNTRFSAPTEPVAAASRQQQTNSPASGQPTISGTAQVGETLAADTSGISDGNGLANATFSYQWLADDADISGATSSTYTLVDADAGKAVKVRVSFTDDAGFGDTLTSTATAAVAEAAPTDPPPAPTNLEVSDNGDGTLTLTWNAPDDDSVTGYQILRRRPQEGEKTLLVYVEDTGSTATTWIDRDVTLDTRHTYRVKAINAAGLSKMSNHERATPQAPAPPPAPTNSPASGQPTISGTAQVGETLTADTSGISDGNGLANATFSYQWLADDADLSGATSSTYTLVDADAGKAVKVRVTFTDDAGFGETLTSAATAAVAALQPDLALEFPVSVTRPAGTYTGDIFTLSIRLRNEGNGVSPATTLRYYQSTDANIETSDTEVGTDAVTMLAAAESISKSKELTAPSTAGTYHYGACVDAVTGESDTTNNCSTSIAVVVLVRNSVATGAPTISGTAQVGETLTADTSGISDGNGLANATFSYQWLADNADISGATSSTYTLVDADTGKSVKVRVSFTDDAGFGETLTSTATAAVAEAAPTDPPPAPTNLEVSDNGDGTLTLTWNAPDDDSVTGYQILRRRPQEGEKTLLVYVEDTGSTATTWTDRDVTLGTRHTYRVKAINAAGLSKVSNHERATPQDPAPNGSD